MDKEQANLFLELLNGFGWIDDADEIIHQMLNDNEVEVVRRHCQLIDRTVSQLNSLVDPISRIKVTAESTLDDILEG